MNEKKDEVMPEGKWEFNKEVTEVFENMLQRSIPQYDVMRKAVTEIAKQYMTNSNNVIDLGCARGDAIADLVDFNRDDIFYGVDVSKPMLEAAKERFSANRNVQLYVRDLKKGICLDVPADVILSVLTIQFTPIEYRLQILRDVYEHLTDGGVFIFVEKVIGETACLDQLFRNNYYAMKESNGYTEEEIERKKLALEGVLVPITATWNEHMLRASGFAEVDCFWRWMNFAGWVAIK